MQTQITKLLTFFTVFFLSKAMIAQQAVCHPTLTKNLLPVSCNYTLTTLDIDAGSSDYQTLYLDKYILTSPGDHVITLTAVATGGQTSSCTCTVTAIDAHPPIIIVLNNVSVVLNNNHEAVLYGEDFDQGSYDCFSDISFDISQSVFGCDDIGDNTITITATDDAGNSNFATVNVNIIDIKNATTSLACNDNIVIPIYAGQEKVLTADMLLEGGPYYCPNHYEVEVLFNNQVRPDDSLYYSDLGKMLVGKIIDPETGNACWGQVTVTNDTCALSFNICDTKSRCEPIGDCNSGHTDTDNIEWPCDINTTVSNDVYLNPSPENLAIYLQQPLNELKPELISIPQNCYAINMAYSDQVIPIDYNIKKIIRKWTLLNWLSGDLFTYVQIIKINKIDGECDMCDFLAWNTPVTDCALGHSATDAVEWPADITIDGSASLADLINNINVHPNDVKPQLSQNCYIGVLFNDTYTNIGSNGQIIRKWELINWITLQNAVYNQIINVTNVDENNRTVCIKRRDGSTINNVTLHEGNVTGTEACKTFTYDENHNIIKPSKNDGDVTEGIDLGDLILLQEYLLGVSSLDNVQKIAADINGSGGITALDVLLLSKIIQGDTSVINNLGSPWRFANVTAYLNASNATSFQDFAYIFNPLYSYHFIGIRIGDIDDSYSSTTSLPTTTVIVEDEVLNKDEIYNVPVIAKQDYRVKGLQFSIEKTDGLKLESVVSDYFNVFQIQEFDNKYEVSWLAETTEAMKDGLPVFTGTPLFKLHFKATKNDVMSNALKFGDELKNRLISPIHLPSYLLKFDWNNVIPVGVKNLENKKLKVYPTVVRNHFTISFDDSMANMSLYNLEGKLLNTQQVHSGSEIDMSQTNEGLYFVTLQYLDGGKEVRKIIKE